MCYCRSGLVLNCCFSDTGISEGIGVIFSDSTIINALLILIVNKKIKICQYLLLTARDTGLWSCYSCPWKSKTYTYCTVSRRIPNLSTTVFAQ